MHLFAGLGNPGNGFLGTRHNIGRETLLAAQRKFCLPAFAKDAKLHALISEGTIGRERVVFVLPETFVNKSGNAVAPAMRRYKLKPDRLAVIHDDADLLLGATKLILSKRSAGHKGVESVMRALKTRDFWRMRIGIQKKRRVPAEDLVLQRFRGNETAAVKKVIKKSIVAIETIVALDPKRAMNVYNA